MTDSHKRATTQAHETVTRSVTRVEIKTKELRSTRSLSRTTETNKHAINNQGKQNHVVGVYRWVNKIERFQIFKYPNRLLCEFQIPEPSSFVRWLEKRGKAKGILSLMPKALTVNGQEDGKIDRR